MLAATVLIAGLFWQLKRRRQARLSFIEAYAFHPAIRRRVKERYPHLNEEQLDRIFEALRDYFYICNLARRRMVAMPSQAVDEAWHTFILFTREYRNYCHKALGRFLHHTPVEAMSSPTIAQQSIKRAWRLACQREGIDPKLPGRLPRLFAIDAELAIPDGFVYQLDCRDPRSPHYGNGYCAAHIGCGGGCSGDSGGNSSDGGSDCGGGGCGGD